MNLRIKKTNKNCPIGIIIPKYKDDAGCDLVSVADIELKPGELGIIRHNFAIEIPIGYFGYIYPRSSTISKYFGNLLIMSSPIDAGYRGEIFTLVRNISSQNEYFIEKGTRLAQLVIIPHIQIDSLEETEFLAKSDRDINGFGSSGK